MSGGILHSSGMIGSGLVGVRCETRHDVTADIQVERV